MKLTAFDFVFVRNKIVHFTDTINVALLSCTFATAALSSNLANL